MRTNLRHLNDDPRPLPFDIERSLPPPPRVVRHRTRFYPAELAEQADRVVVSQLTHIRDNMAHYDAHYPAAAAVRDHLGSARWEKLERYRVCITTFAMYMRKVDREELPFPRANLDAFHKTMKRYVKQACGMSMEIVFLSNHFALDLMIADAARQGVAFHECYPMKLIRECFHRRPYLWFVYNLYFPVVGGRMSWEQLRAWAIWTLENPMEVPSWFAWVDQADLVPLKPPSANRIIWNCALVEILTDIGAKLAAA